MLLKANKISGIEQSRVRARHGVGRLSRETISIYYIYYIYYILNEIKRLAILRLLHSVIFHRYSGRKDET